jgi:predicted 3-demethylubiquinone-9 3-methyltransferase (glyoxalase superfamily)
VQKITPMLSFESQAEEAANFYCAVFKNSRITEIGRYGDTGPGPKGAVMTVAFELDGDTFVALNGVPFKFNEAISLVVNCDDQAEVDRMWEALLADGGKPVACGWLKDKFGLFWQVTPKELMRMIADKDAGKVSRVMGAMMQMIKLDLPTLRKAFEGV